MESGWGFFPLNCGYFWSWLAVCTHPILSERLASESSSPSPWVLLSGHWNNKHPSICTQWARDRPTPKDLCGFQNYPTSLLALVHVLPGFSGDRGWKLASWNTLGWTDWVQEKKRKKKKKRNTGQLLQKIPIRLHSHQMSLHLNPYPN